MFTRRQKAYLFCRGFFNAPFVLLSRSRPSVPDSLRVARMVPTPLGREPEEPLEYLSVEEVDAVILALDRHLYALTLDTLGHVAFVAAISLCLLLDGLVIHYAPHSRESTLLPIFTLCPFLLVPAVRGVVNRRCPATWEGDEQ
jgi:hypothetical protein